MTPPIKQLNPKWSWAESLERIEKWVARERWPEADRAEGNRCLALGRQFLKLAATRNAIALRQFINSAVEEVEAHAGTSTLPVYRGALRVVCWDFVRAVSTADLVEQSEIRVWLLRLLRVAALESVAYYEVRIQECYGETRFASAEPSRLGHWRTGLALALRLKATLAEPRSDPQDLLALSVEMKHARIGSYASLMAVHAEAAAALFGAEGARLLTSWV